LAAALTLCVAPAATAQDTTTQTTTTTTTIQQTTSIMGPDVSHWIASGFVGSNFGAAVSNSSVDFGGQLGYLWRNRFGGEFLAGFTPNFETNNILLGGATPTVNSYMVNAIGAIPLGADANWQPFVSGGFGAITLRTGDLNLANPGTAVQSTFSADDSQFAGNIGFGLMGFAGNWGVRGDVRYFRAFESSDFNADDTASAIAQSVLSGLDFWRANIGVAVRW
jgi:hypothetical protein